MNRGTRNQRRLPSLKRLPASRIKFAPYLRGPIGLAPPQLACSTRPNQADANPESVRDSHATNSQARIHSKQLPAVTHENTLTPFPPEKSSENTTVKKQIETKEQWERGSLQRRNVIHAVRIVAEWWNAEADYVDIETIIRHRTEDAVEQSREPKWKESLLARTAMARRTKRRAN